MRLDRGERSLAMGRPVLRLAAADCEIPLAEAQALFPRGAVDLALAYHRAGDEAMVKAVRPPQEFEFLKGLVDQVIENSLNEKHA